MSWLARSISNSLRIDDFNSDDNHFKPPSTPPHDPPETATVDGDGDFRGVKDDLTEFRDSFTRQLLGVASFLAPPQRVPTESTRSDSFDHSVIKGGDGELSVFGRVSKSENGNCESFHRVVDESTRSESFNPSISRGRDDDDDDDELSVFGRVSKAENGNCKSSFSSQSRFRRVANESTQCESLNPLIYRGDDHDHDHDDDGDEDDDELSFSKAENENCKYLSCSSWNQLRMESLEEAVGLTEEVLTFAGNIGHHPETWLDFPVEDDEDMEDFPMSESQERHAQAVERLTPRLAALRIELCPTHMSVGFFWKVYFVLLHSRLNKQDAALLSTPEVVEARAKWMQEQQKRAKKESEWFHGGLFSRASDEDCTPRSQQNDHSETLSSWTFASEPATSSTTIDSDMEKEKHVSTDPQIMDKSIIDEKPFEETENKPLFLAPISKRPVLRFVDNDDDESDEWPEDDCLDQNVTIIPAGIEDEISFSDLEDDDCCIPVISKP